MNEKSQRSTGIPFPLLVGLAALGVPRVIGHDLSLVSPLVNGLLVFLPLAIWVAYVLWKRVPNPFVPLFVVGLFYGILLGITHQILWTEAFAGVPPRLGGNLGEALSPAGEAVVLRIFAFGSNLFTGALMGAGTGAAAWLLVKAVPAFRHR